MFAKNLFLLREVFYLYPSTVFNFWCTVISSAAGFSGMSRNAAPKKSWGERWVTSQKTAAEETRCTVKLTDCKIS